MKLYFIPFIMLALLSLESVAENLLENPGFEREGGWEAQQSASLRNGWRSHDGGHFNAAVMGSWATKGTSGHIEQRVIGVEPGRHYRLQAWLWADLGWMPERQYMEIVFLDEEGQEKGRKTVELPTIHPYWTPVKCDATAPASSVDAIVRIGASGVSYHGALTIDDVYFGEAVDDPDDQE